ncbi:hypothetical protein [Bacillus thuringiensis]|uniref:Resolvase n=1 Tax=Bacillus thuringiensis serovar kumamotoensis TaxID=132267 RepID=A0A9X6JJ29_BACUK|nr:hypothetical protein [Bacillus thuringiensis]OTZ67131.1 hypothetical protein BK769_31265 [Bacillus thuringiensis serovar kumamtoensis]
MRAVELLSSLLNKREKVGHAKLKPDFKEERPKKYTKKQIDHALNLLKDNFYKQVSEMTGISESTLLRAKKEREKREI